jgi:hypothetical protein
LLFSDVALDFLQGQQYMLLDPQVWHLPHLQSQLSQVQSAFAGAIGAVATSATAAKPKAPIVLSRARFNMAVSLGWLIF